MGADEVITRIKSHWKMKLALSTGVSTVFTAIYLLLQWITLFTVTPVKSTGIDRMIPFVPGAVYLYESLWLMMPIGLWLMRSKDELGRYAKSFFLISLVSFSFFLFFPTSCPRPQDLQNVNSVYGALIRIDRDLNAFPSLHVALAVFCGACCHGMFFRRGWRSAIGWFTWAWVFGIIVSTLLTKQHGVIDALGGAVVGTVSYAYGWRGATRDSEIRA